MGIKVNSGKAHETLSYMNFIPLMQLMVTLTESFANKKEFCGLLYGVQKTQRITTRNDIQIQKPEKTSNGIPRSG